VSIELDYDFADGVETGSMTIDFDGSASPPVGADDEPRARGVVSGGLTGRARRLRVTGWPLQRKTEEPLDGPGRDPARPQALFYLATANRMAGSLQEAITGFERAADNAEDLPRWRARALQAVAETLERMDGQLEPARQAWQAYVRFADSHQAVAFPQIGRARIQAIDVVIEQERAYVEVRQRIAEREAESDE